MSPELTITFSKAGMLAADGRCKTLSAKTEKALRELAQRYQERLATNQEASLADMCFTANTKRSHFDYRLALLTASNVQLQKALNDFAFGKQTTELASGQVITKKRPKIAFLFTGQGSQYVDMGRQLYETASVFRQTLDQCDQIVQPYLGESLLKVLYPKQGETSPLDQTAYTCIICHRIRFVRVVEILGCRTNGGTGS